MGLLAWSHVSGEGVVAPGDTEYQVSEHPWFFYGGAEDRGLRRVRTPFNYGNPTESEQAHLEAINRARLDPPGEADRFGIDLFEGVPEGEISGDPVQPLTFNAALLKAAKDHSADMVARQYFDHVTPEQLSPFDRMQAVGYDFRTAGENIALVRSQGSLVEFDQVLSMHANLFIDAGIEGRGHRVNILNERFREIGIGVAAGGPFMGSANTVMVTDDFGLSLELDNPFLLGVVLDDVNQDGAYGQGEGMGHVLIDVAEAGLATLTATAGGYGIPLTQGSYTVEARRCNGQGARKQMSISDKSVKVDFFMSDFTAPDAGASGDPIPILLVNDTAGRLEVSMAEEVGVSVGMFSGNRAGQSADWWLVHVNGGVSSFDAATLQFVPGLSPTLQFPMFEFCPVEISRQALPAGEHVFCLGVDMIANGTFDADSLFFYCAQVSVN
jgi:uncharacterized protein YkwD